MSHHQWQMMRMLHKIQFSLYMKSSVTQVVEEVYGVLMLLWERIRL